MISSLKRKKLRPGRLAPRHSPHPKRTNVPRRFSGGLPRWLLADGGSEAEAAATGETAAPLEEAPSAESTVLESESGRSEVELNEDQVAALASGFVEANTKETQEEAEADAVVGAAEFEEEEAEEETGETKPSARRRTRTFCGRNGRCRRTARRQPRRS